MSKGQELIRSVMYELIRELEECVEITTLLQELRARFNSYSEEDKRAIRDALLGEEYL